MNRRTPLLIAVALLACLSACARTRYAPTLAAAKAESAKTGRPMLLVFETSWCGWCAKLDRDTLSDKRVAARSETDLVFVRVDAEDGGVGAKLAKTHQIRSFPTVMLMDAEMRPLGRLTGYEPPDAFLRDVERALGPSRELQAALDREKKAPTDPTAILEAAQALEKAARASEALTRWETLAALPGARIEQREQALWRVVAISSKAGDKARKIEALGRIIRDCGTSARLEEAFFELGTTHAQMGDKDDAVSAFERQLKQFPQGRYAPAAQGELTRLGAGVRSSTSG